MTVLLCLVCFGLAVSLEAYEALHDFFRNHESLELDEILIALVMAPFGLVFFAARRLAEAKREATQRRLAEAMAQDLARRDALTGLLNRRAAEEDIAGLLAEAGSGPAAAALMILDLDGFKPVNDQHGHLMGDRLLRIIAERLRGLLRGGDAAYRLGGDEFLLACRLSAEGAEEEARSIARRVVQVLYQPCDLGALRLQVGCSLGIAIAREPVEYEELVRMADLALYRAKADGRGRYCFFEPALDHKLRERSATEAALRQALLRDEMELHFQPIVSLGTAAPQGFEALLRWNRPPQGGQMVGPEGGELPGQFLAVAEESGLILPLGERALRKACAVAMRWPEPLGLTVNLSPTQLRDRALPGLLRAILAETGLPARRLELEVTERALLGQPDLAREMLFALKSMGVRLALDDFGTGYSSLSHLQSLPFDRLKIDRSLVRGLPHDAANLRLIAALLAMGQSLGLPIVAEGVETPEQAEALADLGCPLAQGWLYGRPVPAAAVDRLLAPPGAPPRLRAVG